MQKVHRFVVDCISGTVSVGRTLMRRLRYVGSKFYTQILSVSPKCKLAVLYPVPLCLRTHVSTLVSIGRIYYKLRYNILPIRLIVKIGVLLGLGEARSRLSLLSLNDQLSVPLNLKYLTTFYYYLVKCRLCKKKRCKVWPRNTYLKVWITIMSLAFEVK